MKTVAFHNLGCKVNAYENDIMQQKFVENGYEIVPFDQIADIYVINTCTVTNMADRKSRQMLHRAKTKNPNAVIIGTGCYIQTKTEEALADNGADILIGNNKKSQIVEILNEYLSNHSKTDKYVPDINDGVAEYEPMFLQKPGDRTRAYIKIQDGCNQFCSYCKIPYARGRVRSRDMEEIVEEIKGLADRGVKEFVLTGIHVSSYGITTPNDLSGNRLADLLERIQEIPKVERIRLSSLEPRVVTRDFASRISKLDKLCPHFHLSLQSGCDDTLKRMNRHYTTAEYKEGVSLLREFFDDPAITTDVIVGFPGETAEEFDKSIAFCKDIGFYEMHVFKYSKRSGTVAERLPGQVASSDKDTRSDRMIALADTMSHEYRARHIGRPTKVLTEETKEIEGQTYIIGHNPEYILVAIPKDAASVNEIVEVNPKEFLKEDLLFV